MSRQFPHQSVDLSGQFFRVTRDVAVPGSRNDLGEPLFHRADLRESAPAFERIEKDSVTGFERFVDSAWLAGERGSFTTVSVSGGSISPSDSSSTV